LFCNSIRKAESLTQCVLPTLEQYVDTEAMALPIYFTLEMILYQVFPE
jgi:hypothetical protein